MLTISEFIGVTFFLIMVGFYSIFIQIMGV